MENSKEEQNTIDLHQLLILLRNHVKMILIWTLVAGIVGFATAQFVVVPKYTANVELLVNRKTNSKNDDAYAYNDQQADVQYINTYKDIITNQVILDRVSHELNGSQVARKYGRTYNVPASELKDDIKITNQQNSQVFSVAVTTDDAQKSAAAANTIADVFKKQIKKIMAVNNVTIVSRASVPTAQSFPNVKLFTLAGAVLGLLISVIYLIIKQLLDTTVKADDFMTTGLGLTNLGHISHIEMHHQYNATRQAKKSGSQAERRV